MSGPLRPTVHGHTTHRASTKHTSTPEPKGPRLYDTQRWRLLSKHHLAQHPLCVACEALGVVAAAKEVDHIKRHGGDPTLFWDQDNWQGLCKSCHSTKTAIETRGVATYAKVSRKPAPHVVLVCGSPGSGRLEYVRGRWQRGDTLVDQAGIAAQMAGTARHKAKPEHERSAMAERNARLGKVQASGTMYVIIDAPMHGQRREWKRKIFADEVVIIEREAEDHGPNTLPLAKAWWKRYSSGHDEEIIRI